MDIRIFRFKYSKELKVPLKKAIRSESINWFFQTDIFSLLKVDPRGPSQAYVQLYIVWVQAMIKDLKFSKKFANHIDSILMQNWLLSNFAGPLISAVWFLQEFKYIYYMKIV